MPSSPDVIVAGLRGSFLYMLFVLLGIYLWDFVLSIDFDWMFLSGKKMPRWPMLFYFLGRYLALVSIVGYAIGTFVSQSPVVLYVFFQLTGVCGIGLASINLAIRVIAVWEQRVQFVLAIMALILVHWAFIITALIQAVKDAQVESISVSFREFQAPSSFLNAKLCLVISAQAMLLDLVILASLWYKIYRLGAQTRRTSPTIRVLLRDGSLYFLASLVLNVISLSLGAITLASTPDRGNFSYGPFLSGVFSTMVASRAVRHLSNHMSKQEIIMFSGQKFSLALIEVRVPRTANPMAPLYPPDAQLEHDSFGLDEDTETNVYDLRVRHGDNSPQPTASPREAKMDGFVEEQSVDLSLKL